MKNTFHTVGGFTYYAASYGPRYGDATSTFISLIPGKAEEAAEKGREWEENELPGYCDTKCGDCALCCPDIVMWGESSYAAKDLFTAKELLECKRELLKGETIVLGY